MSEKEVKDVLISVREEVAGVLRESTCPLREFLGIAFTATETEAVDKARAIAKFYKELTDAGIDKETAVQMAQSIFINPTDIIKRLCHKRVRLCKRVNAPHHRQKERNRNNKTGESTIDSQFFL